MAHSVHMRCSLKICLISSVLLHCWLGVRHAYLSAAKYKLFVYGPVDATPPHQLLLH